MSSKGDKLPEHGGAGRRHGSEQRPIRTVLTIQRHIAEIAKKHTDSPITTLSRHMDMHWLYESYHRLRKDSATGVDDQSVADYGEELEGNLANLLEQAKSGKYRAPPVRRKHIPKDGKDTRPIGIPTTENKVLEMAVKMLLEPIYEAEFLDCSYGFRPNRSTHQALAEIRTILKEMKGGWVLDVDIRKYFDTIPHAHLRRILRRRVNDKVILRLIGKWLKAGVWEDGKIYKSGAGTPQGGVISPLLSNIYLHEVLDKWFQEEIVPKLKGRARLIRYCDDFVVILENREEAELLLEKLAQRFNEYGLEIHPDKTGMIDFRHPWKSGKKPETFDFLGFTHYWGKTQRGGYAVSKKTASRKFKKAINTIQLWCKDKRHKPVAWQHKKICEKLIGHYEYYGVRGNSRCLENYRYEVMAIWRYWLNRRSRKRDGMKWSRFKTITETIFPVPKPEIIDKDLDYTQPLLNLSARPCY